MSEILSPYFSVIIPVYKTPLDYFRTCLDSLLNQTISNVEFIIVYDGKDDTLFSLCKDFQKKDFRFKIFVQPHLGVSATRNFGITQARGQYIAFVDADDCLYSNTTLENAYKFQQSHNSDITYFSWFFNNQEKKIWFQDKESLSDKEKEYFLQQNMHIQNPSFSGAPWAKIFRRSFLIENEIHFKEKCVIGQDRVFNYEAILHASKISYSKDIFYKYVINSESATERFRPNFLPVILNYIEELHILSDGKYHSLIGRDAMTKFYLSWEKCYMNPQNKEQLLSRMKELINVVCSDAFQTLIQKVDTKNCSFLFKLETFLLQHKITFWIYLHGLQRTLKNRSVRKVI